MEKQIFIFTAGGTLPREHLSASIDNSINPELIYYYQIGKLNENMVNKIDAGNNNFYAWGAVPGVQNKNNWNSLNEGDYVLTVYENTYHYISRVLGKINHPELAKKIWGVDEDNNTWQYMYFLTKPEKIEVNLSELSRYLHRSYFGFTRISDNRLNDIIQDYNSIDDFMDQELCPGISEDNIVVTDLSRYNVEVTEESSREVSIRTNAAITGNKAEAIFKDRYLQIFPDSIEIKDNTDLHGKGYDFSIKDKDGNKKFIEVKGCKEDLQAIRMTENEWNVANNLGEKYYLVIIYNISKNNPQWKTIPNPCKLNAEKKPTISVTYHINREQIIG